MGDEWIIVLLVIGVASILLLAGVIYFGLIPALQEKQTWLDVPQPVEEAPEEEPEVVQEPPAPNMQALPFDPANPPVARTWPGSDGIIPVRHCLCHGRKVVKGQKVLLWPVVENGAVVDTKVVCRKEGV
jgi:hypothetical protein